MLLAIIVTPKNLPLQPTHRFAERIKSLLQHRLPSLQECTLLRHLRGFRRHELNLTVRHLRHDQGRQDHIWQRLDEMALHNCFGDSIDEVLEFVLWSHVSYGYVGSKNGGVNLTL
jgi:hypothetical protein